MCGLALWKTQSVLQIVMPFKISWTSLVVNQANYVWTKAVAFTKEQRNHGCTIIMLKFLTHFEGISIVPKQFNRALNCKIFKHKTVVSRNVYIDNLSETIDNCKNIYHTIIKMRYGDLVSSTLMPKMITKILKSNTAWKFIKCRVISDPHFPAFSLNMEIYVVNLRI